MTKSNALIGYEDSEDALEASRTGTADPSVIELPDGSYAGTLDITIADNGKIRSWARVPSGVVQVERDDHGQWGIADEVRCECGKWSGEHCEWSGPKDATVIVEWMPRDLRVAHTEARNSGIYPHNGAERIRVERSCADRMVEHDGEWVEVRS